MNTANQNTVNKIAKLMLEMDPMSGSGLGGLAGGTMTTQAPAPLMTFNQLPGMGCQGNECDQETAEQTFSERDLKIAKRFIELIGGADRAKELIEKVVECEECLGLVDDNENINAFANSMPEYPDMPRMM